MMNDELIEGLIKKKIMNIGLPRSCSTYSNTMYRLPHLCKCLLGRSSRGSLTVTVEKEEKRRNKMRIIQKELEKREEEKRRKQKSRGEMKREERTKQKEEKRRENERRVENRRGGSDTRSKNERS